VACTPNGASGNVGVGVGQQAPPLSGTTLDGRTVSLADFRGKPVVVNFWASWCVPCRNEFPLFKDAEARHPELVFLGVVYQDDARSAAAFATTEGANWSSLTDPDGSRAKEYQVVAPPQSYFIDRNGIVRSRQIGEVSRDDFERQFAAIAG
jgi:cytochrome c biogenesis protein CcmG, thiol:disulfide interchange protein DsbE